MKYPGTLHAHTDRSNFRLKDCINKPSALIDYALELGHEVLAITDHETISAAITASRYYRKIKENNPQFKLILGNEIYLCRNGLSKENYERGKDKFYHFILLAKDAEGHRQLRQLSTRAWSRAFMYGKMKRVPTYYNDLIEIIYKNQGHVIGSSACLGGELPSKLMEFKETKDPEILNSIHRWIENMKKIFGEGNFFFELQPSDSPEQVYVNKELIKLSKEFNVPYIITTDAHYLKKEDFMIHHAYLTSQDGERETESFYKTTYLLKDDEMDEYLLKSITEEEIEIGYKNILKIKEMCEDYNLEKELKIPRLKWKEPAPIKDLERWCAAVPYFQTFLNSEYKEDKILTELLINYIETHPLYQEKEALEEVNECMKSIWISSEKNNARWSAYFLNLQNIVDTCWESGSLVGAGRGSGVGFCILYMLGITQIDPLREKTRTFRWRFLNPDRVSVLDVDIDIESNKRSRVLNNFRRIYGSNRVANVLTLGTEKSKSAILTAARGLGIDVDIAQYLSSMIVSDRGQLRTLKETFYGDEEKGYLPNMTFRKEMEENYPQLWEVAQAIEGLVSRVGEHAGGVIFVDEDFENSTALMEAPSGDIITQFDLHESESVGLIKYDILSISALDKIHICLDLLQKFGYVETQKNLKETYESVIGIYNLIREDKEMWEMCWKHKVSSLFQMEEQSGVQGIAALRPTSVDDLAILNSVIRLMPQTKNAELPLDKLVRFKENPKAWDEELRFYGLGEEEKKILEPVVGISYGLCIAQEQFMELVQLPELGGFDLTWADSLRKSIAKKNPAAYEALTKEYFETVRKKKCNMKLCTYVWNVLIAMSRGYGF